MVDFVLNEGDMPPLYKNLTFHGCKRKAAE